MKKVTGFVINALAFFLTDFMLAEVTIPSFLALFSLSLLFSLWNTFIMPFLKILTLPLQLLTFGLFTFLLNALLLYLIHFFLPHLLSISSFFGAMKMAFFLALVSSGLNWLFK